MFTELEMPKPELSLIRLGGQLSSLCSRDVLLGPMRTALVSAAQANALAKNEIGLFVQTCTSFVHLFSVWDSDLDDVQMRIRDLIERSVENRENAFTIPWI
jgi:hypothetical protein